MQNNSKRIIKGVRYFVSRDRTNIEQPTGIIIKIV